MVEEPVIYPYTGSNSWSKAWAIPAFRKKIITVMIVFTVIMILLPHFFSIIEARHGVVLNDWVLQQIPARDFSAAIFIFLWATSLLIIIRSIQQPAIFLLSMYLLVIITITRVITISLFPLDAPPGIIHLKDPITSLTYGGREIFITKDLFFSGHTSNVFMFYLCFQKKGDKQFALLATIMVGSLVLVQHIHYTIDVIAALIYTYYLVKIAKRFSFFTI